MDGSTRVRPSTRPFGPAQDDENLRAAFHLRHAEQAAFGPPCRSTHPRGAAPEAWVETGRRPETKLVTAASFRILTGLARVPPAASLRPLYRVGGRGVQGATAAAREPPCRSRASPTPSPATPWSAGRNAARMRPWIAQQLGRSKRPGRGATERAGAERDRRRHRPAPRLRPDGRGARRRAGAGAAALPRPVEGDARLGLRLRVARLGRPAPSGLRRLRGDPPLRHDRAGDRRRHRRPGARRVRVAPPPPLLRQLRLTQRRRRRGLEAPLPKLRQPSTSPRSTPSRSC